MLDNILSAIGTIFYPLFSVVFLLIQIVQAVFYSFAGIGDNITIDTSNWYYNDDKKVTITSGNSGGETDTGILYYFMNTTLVRNLLISIAVLALFLLIIFTAMAFIKNAYSSKPKSWQDIVSSAFKGLANFVFIPVCCLLGVWLGNILLKAINSATSSGNSAYMDRKLFISAAYNANVYRTANVFEAGDSKGKEAAESLTGLVNYYFSDNPFGTILDDQNSDYYADLVDQIYSYVEENPKNGRGCVPIHNWSTVGERYRLWEINYLIIVVGGIFMLYVLGSLAFAMVKRIFILLTLFVISPAICSMYPLDDGKAVGSWKGKFIPEVISAYGAVAGMNIFFSLLPLVDTINVGLWGGDGTWTSSIIQLFIMCTGLFCVKDLIGMLAGLVGGNDAYATGAGLMSGVTKKVKDKTATVTKGAFNYGRSVQRQGIWSASLSAGLKVVTMPGRSIVDAAKSGIGDADKAVDAQRKARVLNSITRVNDLKSDAGMDAAYKQAKAAGVEKDLAEVIARRLSDESWRAAGGDKTKYMQVSGEKLLEEKKNLETLKDAADGFQDAVKKFVEDKDSSITQVYTLAASGAERIEFEDRISSRKGYSAQEIQTLYNAGDIDKAKRYEEVNAMIEKSKQLFADVKSAGAGLKDPMISASKNKIQGLALGDVGTAFNKDNVNSTIDHLVDEASRASSASYPADLKIEYTDSSGAVIETTVERGISNWKNMTKALERQMTEALDEVKRNSSNSGGKK